MTAQGTVWAPHPNLKRDDKDSIDTHLYRVIGNSAIFFQKVIGKQKRKNFSHYTDTRLEKASQNSITGTEPVGREKRVFFLISMLVY